MCWYRLSYCVAINFRANAISISGFEGDILSSGCQPMLGYVSSDTRKSVMVHGQTYWGSRWNCVAILFRSKGISDLLYMQVNLRVTRRHVGIYD